MDLPETQLSLTARQKSTISSSATSLVLKEVAIANTPGANTVDVTTAENGIEFAYGTLAAYYSGRKLNQADLRRDNPRFVFSGIRAMSNTLKRQMSCETFEEAKNYSIDCRQRTRAVSRRYTEFKHTLNRWAGISNKLFELKINT